MKNIKVYEDRITGLKAPYNAILISSDAKDTGTPGEGWKIDFIVNGKEYTTGWFYNGPDFNFEEIK